MVHKIEDKDKVRALLKYYKTNQTEFAARLGFSQSALAHWISRNKIPFDVIHKISETCDEVSFSWLVTGLGPMLLKDGGKTETEMSFEDETKKSCQDLIPGLDCDEFIQCQGFFLEPAIHQGDYIGIKKVKEGEVIDPERIYLVTMDDDTKMLRYVAVLNEEEYELSTESSRRTLNININKVKRLDKVVFTGRML